MDKKDIVKFLDLIESAKEKTYLFEKSIENYTGDRFYVPAILPEIEDAINILWSYVFKEDSCKDGSSSDNMTWLEWHMYENNFGKNKLSAFLDNKRYIISSNEKMASFLLKWIK